MWLMLQYLACLSTCSSSDKLSFDVGVQETKEGESSWWTVHPASKQRSEGEKVPPFSPGYWTGPRTGEE